jgi:hypothetical protein
MEVAFATEGLREIIVDSARLKPSGILVFSYSIVLWCDGVGVAVTPAFTSGPSLSTRSKQLPLPGSGLNFGGKMALRPVGGVPVFALAARRVVRQPNILSHRNRPSPGAEHFRLSWSVTWPVMSRPVALFCLIEVRCPPPPKSLPNHLELGRLCTWATCPFHDLLLRQQRWVTQVADTPFADKHAQQGRTSSEPARSLR